MNDGLNCAIGLLKERVELRKNLSGTGSGHKKVVAQKWHSDSRRFKWLSGAHL